MLTLRELAEKPDKVSILAGAECITGILVAWDSNFVVFCRKSYTLSFLCFLLLLCSQELPGTYGMDTRHADMCRILALDEIDIQEIMTDRWMMSAFMDAHEAVAGNGDQQSCMNLTKLGSAIDKHVPKEGYMNLDVMRRMAVAAFCFLMGHSDSHGFAKTSRRPLPALLWSVAFLIRLKHKDQFHFFLDTPQYGMLIGKMNEMALLHFKPDTAEWLAGNSDLVDAVYSSMDYDFKALQDILHSQLRDCSTKNVFLVFALFIIARSFAHNRPPNPQLKNFFLATFLELNWKPRENPVVFLRVLISHIQAKYLTEKFSVPEIVRHLFGTLSIDVNDIAAIVKLTDVVETSVNEQEQTVKVVRCCMSTSLNQQELVDIGILATASKLCTSALHKLLQRASFEETVELLHKILLHSDPCPEQERVEEILCMAFYSDFQATAVVQEWLDESSSESKRWAALVLSKGILTGREVLSTESLEHHEHLGPNLIIICNLMDRHDGAFQRLVSQKFHGVLGTVDRLFKSDIDCLTRFVMKTALKGFEDVSSQPLSIHVTNPSFHSLDDLVTAACHSLHTLGRGGVKLSMNSAAWLVWSAFCIAVGRICSSLFKRKAGVKPELLASVVDSLEKAGPDTNEVILLRGMLLASFQPVLEMTHPQFNSGIFLSETTTKIAACCRLATDFLPEGVTNSSAMNGFVLLKGKVGELQKRLKDGDFTQMEHGKFSANLDLLNDLITLCGFEKVSLHSWKEAMESAKYVQTVMEWLRGPGGTCADVSNHIDELKTLVQSSNTPLKSILLKTAKLKEMFIRELSQPLDTTFADVCFADYITKVATQSAIAKHLVLQTSKSRRTAQHSWQHQARSCLQKLHEKLKALLLPDTQCSVLADICEGIQPGDVAKAVEVLKRCDLYREEDVALDRLAKTAFIGCLRIRESKAVAGILYFLRDIVEDDDLGKLRAEGSEQDLVASMTLFDFKASVDRVASLLMVLEPGHLKFFACIGDKKYRELLEYFRKQLNQDEEFARRLQTIRGFYEEDLARGDLMDSLLDILPLAKAVIIGEMSASATLKRVAAVSAPAIQLLENVCMQRQLVEELVANTFDSAYDRARQNVIGLTSAGDTVPCPTVSFHLDHSCHQYIFKCTYVRLQDEKQEVKVLEPGALQETRLSLPYFKFSRTTTAQSPSPVCSDLTKSAEVLLEMFALVDKIVGHILTLDAEGNVEFLDRFLGGEAVKFDTGSLKRCCEKLVEGRDLWRKQLFDVKERSPCLSLFYDRDIGLIIRELIVIRRVTKQGDRPLPECQLNPKNLWHHITSIGKLVPIKPDITPDDMLNEIAASSSHCMLQLLEEVAGRLYGVFTSEVYANTMNSQTLYFVQDAGCKGLDPMVLPYLAETLLGGGFPCHSQIEFCTANTSGSRLSEFFERMRVLPGHNFALVGIESLSYLRRRQLQALQRMLRVKQCRVGVHYLCQCKATFDAWPNECFDAKKDFPYRPVSSLTGIQCVPFSLPTIECVTGRDGVGKSHYIRDQCNKKHSGRPVMINIHSTDNDLHDICAHLGDAFIELPGRATSPRPVSFNIIALHKDDLKSARYQANALFFHLLHCGSLRSEDGTAIFSMPGPRIEWKWYVEVPHVFSNTEGNLTVQSLLNHLPSLKLASQSCELTQVTTDQHPLEIDGGIQNLAGIMQSYYDGTLAGCNACFLPTENFLCYNPVVDPKDCRTLLLKVFKEVGVDLSSRQKQMFVLKYLKSKFTMLFPDSHSELKRTYASDTFKSFLQTSSNYAMLIVKHALGEAAELCKSKSSCSFKKCAKTFLLFDSDDKYFLLLRPEFPKDKEEDLKIKWRPNVDSSAANAMNYGVQNLQSREARLTLLGHPFGINEHRVITSLLDSIKFVLTADLTFKLLQIHMRRKQGLPLIIQGETGAGKTFLLKAYTLLLNHEASHNQEEEQSVRLVLRMNTFLENFFLDSWMDLEKQQRFQFCGYIEDDFPKNKKVECGLIASLSQESDTPEEFLAHWSTALSILDESTDLQQRLVLAARDQIKKWCGELCLVIVSQRLQKLLALSEITVSESKDMVHEWLTSKVHSLFFKLLVHPGLTKGSIKEFVAEARSLADKLPRHRVVVFFDEVNTSSCLGLFNEIIMDGCIDGVEINANGRLFFVAAVNPSSVNNDNTENQFQDPGEPGTDMFCEHYAVHSLPKAMEEIMWEYGNLQESGELQEYITEKVRLMEASKETKDSMCYDGRDLKFRGSSVTEMICKAHDYYKRFGKSFVSQRDVQRVFNLIPFFVKLSEYRRRIHQVQVDDVDVVDRCVALAISVVYYFRLPVKPMPKSKFSKACRKEFDDYICYNTPSSLFKTLSLTKLVTKTVDVVVNDENFKIPKGVGLTSALKENIFCTLVCIERQIPLGIIGEPGSSKSLSYHIICDSMAEMEPTEFCKQFVAVDSVFHSCSEDTTEEQINIWFKKAEAKQKRHNKRREDAIAADRTRQRELDADIGSISSTTSGVDQLEEKYRPVIVTLFIDEAGLPSRKKNRMVMKVLHPHLDEPKVSFVALSNHWFDAANTNRMLTLFRSQSDNNDLTVLAMACLQRRGARFDGEPDPTREEVEFVKHVCDAYADVKSDERFSRWFHHRDLIALFRQIRRDHGVGDLAQSQAIQCTYDNFQRHLEENFGGRTTEEYADIRARFFRHLDNQMLRSEGRPQPHTRNPFEILISMKNELVLATGDYRKLYLSTNQLAPRYQLIINAMGSNDMLLDVLFQLGILDQSAERTRVFQLMALSQDEEDDMCWNMVAKIRQSLDQPCTIVICDSPRLHGYLYDLLNQNFLVSPFNGRNHAYTRVPMGDSVLPCPVHDEFRCVVMLRDSLAAKERTPFLSRFVKIRLDRPEDILDILDSSCTNVTLKEVHERCSAFWKEGGLSHFYGLPAAEPESQPLACTLLPCLVGTADAGTPTELCQSFGGQRKFNLKPELEGSHQDAMYHLYKLLVQLLPLEHYLTVRDRLKPVAEYDTNYITAKLGFTLFSILEHSLLEDDGQDVNNTRSRKLLLITRTQSERISSLQDKEKRARLMRSDLASLVTVVSTEDFHQMLDAEVELSRFLLSTNRCLLFTVDSLDNERTRLMVSMLKYLIDEQASLNPNDFLVQGNKFIVILVNVPIPVENQDSFVPPALFLNKWNTFSTDIPSAKHLNPISMTDLLGEVLKVDEQLEDVDSLTLRLTKDLYKNINALASDTWTLLDSHRMATDDHSSDSNAISCFCSSLEQYVGFLRQWPAVFSWLAESIAFWLKGEAKWWLKKKLKEIQEQTEPLSLIDCIWEFCHSVISELLLRVSRVFLFNLKQVREMELSDDCVRKFLELVSKIGKSQRPLPYCLPDGIGVGQHATRVPFFSLLKDTIDTTLSEYPDTDKPELVHSRMNMNKVLRTIFAEAGPLHGYAYDYVVDFFQWNGSEQALDVAVKYLKLLFQNYKRSSQIALVHSKVFPMQTDIRALLNSTHAVLSLPGAESQAVKLASWLEEQDDELAFFANFGVMIIGILWEVLQAITKGLVSVDGRQPLIEWQTCFQSVTHVWPLYRDTAICQENVAEVVSAVRDRIRSECSKQLRVLAVVGILLEHASEDMMSNLTCSFLTSCMHGDQSYAELATDLLRLLPSASTYGWPVLIKVRCMDLLVSQVKEQSSVADINNCNALHCLLRGLITSSDVSCVPSTSQYADAVAIPVVETQRILRSVTMAISEEHGDNEALFVITNAVRKELQTHIADIELEQVKSRKDYWPSLYTPPGFPAGFCGKDTLPPKWQEVMSKPLVHAVFHVVYLLQKNSQRKNEDYSISVKLETAHKNVSLNDNPSTAADAVIYAAKMCAKICVALEETASLISRFLADQTESFGDCSDSPNGQCGDAIVHGEDTRLFMPGSEWIDKIFEQHGNQKFNDWLLFLAHHILSTALPLDIQWLDWLDGAWASHLHKVIRKCVDCMTNEPRKIRPDEKTPLGLLRRFHGVPRAMEFYPARGKKMSVRPGVIDCVTWKEAKNTWEMCFFLHVYQDHFLKGSEDIGKIINDVSGTASPLLQRALSLLSGQQTSSAQYSKRLFGSGGSSPLTARDSAVRTVLVDVMATCIYLDGLQHPFCLLVTDPASCQGSLVFGARDRRRCTLGNAGSMDAFFPLSEPSVECSAIDQHHCHLTRTAHTVCALLSYACLLCNIILFPEQNTNESGAALVVRRSDTEAASRSAEASINFTTSVCLSLVLACLSGGLPDSDINLPPLGASFFIHSVLERYCVAVTKHRAKQVYWNQYSSLEQGVLMQAEHDFQVNVVNQALVVHGRDLHSFLQIMCKDVPRYPRFNGCHGSLALLSCLHQQNSNNEYPFLAAVYRNLSIMTMIPNMLNCAKLCMLLQQALSLAFTEEEVHGSMLTLADSMKVLSPSESRRIRQCAVEAFSAYDALIREMDRLPEELDEHFEPRMLTFDTPVAEVVRTSSGGSKEGCLYRIIKYMVRWIRDFHRECDGLGNSESSMPARLLASNLGSSRPLLLSSISCEGSDVFLARHVKLSSIRNLVMLYCSVATGADGVSCVAGDIRELELAIARYLCSQLYRVVWDNQETVLVLATNVILPADLPRKPFQDTLSEDHEKQVSELFDAKQLTYDAVHTLVNEISLLVHDVSSAIKSSDDQGVSLSQFTLGEFVAEHKGRSDTGYLLAKQKFADVPLKQVVSLALSCSNHSAKYLHEGGYIYAQIPQHLKRKLPDEVQWVLDKKLELESFKDDHQAACNTISDVIAGMYMSLPQFEDEPNKSLLSVLYKACQTKSSSDLAMAIPNEVLGFHFCPMLKSLLHLRQKHQSRLLAQQTAAGEDKDPCCFGVPDAPATFKLQIEVFGRKKKLEHTHDDFEVCFGKMMKDVSLTILEGHNIAAKDFVSCQIGDSELFASDSDDEEFGEGTAALDYPVLKVYHKARI